jgi:dTDP-4-amino-4,6-dideoxygalactose transaminase
MKVNFVDLKTQYQSIKDEIRVAMDEVLNNTAYILGKPVAEFETRFAVAHNVKYCWGTSSGTDGNHLVLWALGIGPGDEVIIPADTFIATVWGATLCGAKPVFVDVHPESYNLDAKKVAAAITPKTKAIVAVHLYGQATDVNAIYYELGILNYEFKEQGLFRNKDTGQVIYLVEDCAQAHLAEYNGKKVGGLGIASSFSFYPGKNLGAYGEGGAVCTNDDELGKKFRMMREHGSGQKYHHEIYGHNYRMEGLQGAVLGVKLKYLDKWTTGRRQVAEWYRKYLGDCEYMVLPKEMEGNWHVYHLYVVRVRSQESGDRKQNRDELVKYLGENEIATGLHYPIPLHLQPCFKHLGYNRGNLPVTEDLADNCISLPMYPELAEEQVKYVCEKVKAFFKV